MCGKKRNWQTLTFSVFVCVAHLEVEGRGSYLNARMSSLMFYPVMVGLFIPVSFILLFVLF